MLSNVSRIFESEICRSSACHAKVQVLYSDRQWGYSEGKSTEALLLLLTEKWKHTVENGEVVGTLFIDCRNTFDSIDHQILLKSYKG